MATVASGPQDERGPTPGATPEPTPGATPEPTPEPTPFTRLCVANRGEIARRVLRTARSSGIETVAVFAEDDRRAPYVAEADRAVPLGAGPVRDTYLSVERVVDAATGAGADALHPGYGFLSEDPRLAEACAAAGIVWVGPPPAAMATMGHKAQAKAVVAAAGVPVLGGRTVDAEHADDPAALADLGEAVGYPLLVKASAGGGGRGMRLVEDAADLLHAVTAARREALASFGSDEVFLERYVVAPRHVEVQVAADRHGNVVHLYDRECSVQRRHQKVVEEAPASLVPTAVRQVMWRSAVDAARAVGYEGVGTVEFVVGGPGGGDCAFLEMNTRLQVEHGITELVTGIDLVALQLHVAAGLPIPFRQGEVEVRGHAVEARLCAERPRQAYRPTPGTVLHARWPSGAGVRVDAAVETGTVVSPVYDSLVAKIMALGDRRRAAVARLRAALGGPLELDGVETNRSLLAAVLGDADFLAGRTPTDFLDRHPEVVAAALADAARRRHVAAAGLYLEHLRAAGSLVPGSPGSWRNVGTAEHWDRFTEGDDEWSVSVVRRGAAAELRVAGPGGDGAPIRVTADVHTVAPGGTAPGGTAPGGTAPGGTAAGGWVDMEADGVLVRCRIRCHRRVVAVSSPEGQSTLHLVEEDAAEGAGPAAGECRAPLPGSVVRVLVAVGDDVDADAALVVMEAMKMEHTLRAAGPGTVEEVRTAVGAQVDVGDVLVVVVGDR